MTNFNLKEETDRLMRIKGNSRGEILRTHANYIQYREGGKGIEAVEEKMEEIGYPLKFKEIKPLSWYPESLGILVILVAKQLFKWEDADIIQMGAFAPKYSFIVKLFLKYFISLENAFKKASTYWKKHYDFGELEIGRFNEKEKYLKFRVKEHKFHPIVCTFWRGYFAQFAHYIIISKEITVEEIKCMFKGDPYHEFVVRWE